MKGFIYFLELAISAILIAIILITFFTVGIKQDWERSHLISIGNDIFNHLRNSGNTTKVLNNDTSDIDTIIPPNIGYTLKVFGSSKPNIKVGCTDITSCDYVNVLLTDTYVNDHWVNFTLEQFDISDGIPSDYDAVVFVDLNDGYSIYKEKIQDYLDKEGVVIGINAFIGNQDFFGIFGLTEIAPTETLYEYYNTGNDVSLSIYADKWMAQTFTVGTVGANENHNIISVKLKLRRYGSPGTIVASIKAVDGSGKPIGEDLTNGTYDGNSLGTTSSWHEISLTPYTLSKDTQYAIVLKAPYGVLWNHINWDNDGSNPTYAGGSMLLSYDSGDSWTDSGYDTMFEEYGIISLTNFSYEDILRYFLGFGFDVKVGGYWYIWEEPWNVSQLSANTVNISKDLEYHVVNEGEKFSLRGPDGKNYSFKVRNISFESRTDIQPLNKSFHFKDFTIGDPNRGKGKVNIIIYPPDYHASMTTNNSAIWISDFPWSDEYKTLIKAAIASRVKEWFTKEYNITKEITPLSAFVPFCCNMPEIAELTFYLWYKI